MSSRLLTRTAYHPNRMGVGAFMLAGIEAWRQRRALANLDPHLLRDIGVTDAEAAREAAKPVWDVPGHWLR